MTNKFKPFTPTWKIPPPGATIADILEERGWKNTELAKRSGYSSKHISLLIQGKAPINEETALKLERVLGGSVRFWLIREAHYRESLIRIEEERSLQKELDWLKKLPLKDMITFKWIKQYPNKMHQVSECLRFFGVASVSIWEEKYEKQLVMFRSSSKFTHNKGSVAAWLRQGERVATTIQSEPFDRSLFIKMLDRARDLTQETDITVIIPSLTKLCSKVGIAFVVIPAPTGCYASGATQWISSTQALIILSNRYQSNDQFWFSFFHEAGHLYRHGKKLLFIDIERSEKNAQEEEADLFAEDSLIPLHFINDLSKLKLTKDSIESFANKIGIAPGIVVGRLQKEKLLPWNHHLNNLKVKFPCF